MAQKLVSGYPLYPLANPKGSKLICELCQKPAFLQCVLCKVTYYCTAEHQKTDWVSIHEKICAALAVLRAPMPFIKTEEERRIKRDQYRQQQLSILEMTRQTGQKLLFQSKYDEAVPTALQCLKFIIDLYGMDSVELVEAYLILGEASIGLNRLAEAEEYLAQAQWTVLKSPDCSNSIKSQLHRKLGLLFSAKNDFPNAMDNLAHDIFFSSTEFGTDDVRTAGGYFTMAQVFLQQDQFIVADDLMARVTEIWSKFLVEIVKSITFKPVIPEGIGEVVAEITQIDKLSLNEAQQAEAIRVLGVIYSIRENQPDKNAHTHLQICLAKSLLAFILNDQENANYFFREASASYSEENTTEDLEATYQLMKTTLS